MPLQSMPLAAGYLKAMVLDDPELRAAVSVDICNLRGGTSHGQMARALFADSVPDVLAFSVFGWSFRAFLSLADTFKQLNPHGMVVFGGTHVSNQAERVFGLSGHVDVVVNGEGELTFRELVRARLAGAGVHELGGIEGISWRSADGAVRTNPDRPRIEDLDSIPSPFLTGAIEMTDENGEFPYDVALIETNRGCPYKCAFCYWGGAVGQRVRAFSRQRLRAEIELFAKLGVHTIVACDANFGMLPIDVEFVEDLIEIKQSYGYPRAFESSWAKNKSKVFFDIVHRMKEAGLRSSFTLALQTLSNDALEAMNRRNMKVNDWHSLVEWLDAEGLDCYAELIWGAPGETVDSFLRGYDELSEHVSRIAVYPIMLLPNTDFSENRELHGIVALRGDQDDFEYVLAHRTMSFADDARMQRFMFWARVMAENAVLRHSWLPLRKLAGWSQSTVLENLADWVDGTDLPQAEPLKEAAAHAQGGGAPAYAKAISYLFTSDAGRQALIRWWTEAVAPRLAEPERDFLTEVFRYDLWTQPVCPATDEQAAPDEDSRPAAGNSMTPADRTDLAAGLSDLAAGRPLPPLVELAGDRYYVQRDLRFRYDIPAMLAALRRNQRVELRPRPTSIDLYYRTGALNAVLSTNHEEIVHFMGEPDPDRLTGRRSVQQAS